MDIEYLKKLSQKDRLDIMSADAVSIEDTRYTKPLTPDEIAFYKDQLTDSAINQATIIEELTQLKKQFSDRLKPIQKAITSSLHAIKYKAIDCEGTLYFLADYDEQMIYGIDQDGNMITVRKMLPHERQLRIQPSKQQQS